ncbi:MAG TPA: glycogen-binding domain-containing protein [Candidatus Omnitrophota bacterium]|nr:glycogen-binding domain-containing protein [Candidatus Omnitrophota bacterium]HRZ15747.1 glycogen-binding domain-containing protein [Candidatus Omnitrophota bacterium]
MPRTGTVSKTDSKPKVAKVTQFKIAMPKAKRVSVAGTFNNWDTNSLLAKKDVKGTWAVKVNLTPGTYEYKFFVDGSWLNDPQSQVVYNSFGTQNSVIEVK